MEVCPGEEGGKWHRRYRDVNSEGCPEQWYRVGFRGSRLEKPMDFSGHRQYPEECCEKEAGEMWTCVAN